MNMESNNPIKFRNLTENEIECRVGRIYQRGGQTYGEILLYQDARAAQRILDDVFGLDWKNDYTEISGETYCTISIWNSTRQCWVTRQNVGTESNIESVKGRASDAFKRAASTLGIGRSLYSAPKISIPLKEGTEFYIDKVTGKPKTSADFDVRVVRIKYDNQDNICSLVLADKEGLRYAWDKPAGLTDEQIDNLVSPGKAAAPAQQAATATAEAAAPAEKKTTKKPAATKPVETKVETQAPVAEAPAPAPATPQMLFADSNPTGKPVLSKQNEKWSKGVVQIAKMPQNTTIVKIHEIVTNKFFISAEDFKTLLIEAGRISPDIADSEWAKIVQLINAAA